MHLHDLPPDARPREKLLARGAGALADAELLALLLRTGIRGKGVLQMAHDLLQLPSANSDSNGFGGIAGLLSAREQDLRRSSTIFNWRWQPGRTKCSPCCSSTCRTACWPWRRCSAAP